MASDVFIFIRLIKNEASIFGMIAESLSIVW